MILKPYHKFEKDGKVCVLLVRDLTSSFVSDATARALDDLGSCGVVDPSSSMVPVFQGLNLIAASKRGPWRENGGEAPYGCISRIALFTSFRCNMKCVYCYGDQGQNRSGEDMPRETARQTIDWMAGRSGTVKHLFVSFFGGEPLLSPGLVGDVVDYARQKGNECAKTFEFGMTTNGSLLNQDRVAFLRERDIRPMVSFDGPADIQDAQRPFKDGKGSYGKILPGIRRLLSIMPDVGCRATLFGPTHPSRIREALWGAGFSFVKMLVVSPSPCDEPAQKLAMRNFEGMAELVSADMDAFLENTKARNGKNLKKLLGSKPLGEMIARFLTRHKRGFFCGAGKSYAAVSPSGDVFPCHRFAGMDDFKIGNVFHGDLNVAEYLKSPLTFVEACSRCLARHVCGGGCYYDHLVMTGSIFEPAQDFCGMMKDAVERIAFVNACLDKEDRSWLSTVSPTFRKPCPLDFP